ncbi:hypothetical protein NDU88_003683 [Pleurodeles waltl]|uniref:Uncharacterized protein n=1 Tax=Pleurodeles waltl TaxID=8319 RepID=A0AAV7V2G8_PLEWA|nr:hypothetical protein NDU88_003683 [Pleurodeles waltl]
MPVGSCTHREFISPHGCNFCPGVTIYGAPREAPARNDASIRGQAPGEARGLGFCTRASGIRYRTSVGGLEKRGRPCFLGGTLRVHRTGPVHPRADGLPFCGVYPRTARREHSAKLYGAEQVRA